VRTILVHAPFWGAPSWGMHHFGAAMHHLGAWGARPRASAKSSANS